MSDTLNIQESMAVIDRPGATAELTLWDNNTIGLYTEDPTGGTNVVMSIEEAQALMAHLGHLIYQAARQA